MCRVSKCITWLIATACGAGLFSSVFAGALPTGNEVVDKCYTEENAAGCFMLGYTMMNIANGEEMANAAFKKSCDLKFGIGCATLSNSYRNVGNRKLASVYAKKAKPILTNDCKNHPLPDFREQSCAALKRLK